MRAKMGLAALLLLAVVLCASGCSGRTPGGGTDSGEADGKAVQLKFMHMGAIPQEGDEEHFITRQFPALVEDRFPGIALETEMLPDESYIKTLLVQLSSGEGPDFFEWWPKRQLEELVRAGYLRDLTGLDVLSRFSPDLLKEFTVDGKVYGLPKGFSMMGTWYNKTLLAEAGYETFPQDWQAFLDMCEALKKQGTTPIVMPDKEWRFIQFGLFQLAATAVYSEDMGFDEQLLAGERSFADSPWRDVLTRYKLLYDREYVAEGSLQRGAAQAAAMFRDGEAAMMFNGNWDYVNMTETGEAGFERGFMPLPGNEPGERLYLSVGPAGGTVVNANTEHLEEIGRIMAFQYEPASPLNEKYKRNYAAFPMEKGGRLDIPELAAYTELMKTLPSVYFSNQAWPVGVAEALCAAFQEWIAGNGTVDDVLRRMDEALARLNGR